MSDYSVVFGRETAGLQSVQLLKLKTTLPLGGKQSLQSEKLKDKRAEGDTILENE